MLFFRRHKNIDFSDIISILETGNLTDLQQLLWQPRKGRIEYLPITMTMLQKLKKSESSSDNLTIHQKIDKGNFELVIFSTPWTASRIPYSPLIFDKRHGKIVGVMLPFNELYNVLSQRDRNVIGELGAEWIEFTLPFNFK